MARRAHLTVCPWNADRVTILCLAQEGLHAGFGIVGNTVGKELSLNYILEEERFSKGHGQSRIISERAGERIVPSNQFE